MIRPFTFLTISLFRLFLVLDMGTTIIVQVIGIFVASQLMIAMALRCANSSYSIALVLVELLAIIPVPPVSFSFLYYSLTKSGICTPSD